MQTRTSNLTHRQYVAARGLVVTASGRPRTACTFTWQSWYVEKAPIFISWSGEASRMVAEALRSWLAEVFQTTNPFVSSEDIAAGSVWFETIGQELRRSDFAIICVTPENRMSPWLHFEAGAIGMAHSAAEEPTPRSVVPYLLELSASSLDPPLSQYQALIADEVDSRRLAAAINRRVPAPLAPASLDRTFEKWWPDLVKELDAARKVVAQGSPPQPQREERDILEELLALARRSAQVESRLPSSVGTPAKPSKLTTSILAASGLRSIDAAMTELKGAGLSDLVKIDYSRDKFRIILFRDTPPDLQDLIRKILIRHGLDSGLIETPN